MNVDDTAVNVDDTAVNVDDTAVNVDDTAVNVDDTAVNVDDTAVNVDDTAVNVDHTAVNLEDKLAMANAVVSAASDPDYVQSLLTSVKAAALSKYEAVVKEQEDAQAMYNAMYNANPENTELAKAKRQVRDLELRAGIAYKHYQKAEDNAAHIVAEPESKGAPDEQDPPIVIAVWNAYITLRQHKNGTLLQALKHTKNQKSKKQLQDQKKTTVADMKKAFLTYKNLKTPTVDPAPADPAPADLAPADPALVDPALVDPAPADLAPADPAPADLAPADPAHVDPAHVDPAPSG